MAPASIAACLACLFCGLILGVMLGLGYTRRQLFEYEARFRQAVDEARTDPLTGLWNRKAFDEAAMMQTAVARRYGGPLSLLVVDVDRFKTINDAEGHAAGDHALQKLAQVIRETTRESDFVARLGGDEFALLLPQTDAPGAAVLAQRIRERLVTAQQSPATSESKFTMTFSGGIAMLTAGETATSLLERADQALYHAKESGRDRIHEHDGTNPGSCRPEKEALAQNGS